MLRRAVCRQQWDGSLPRYGGDVDQRAPRPAQIGQRRLDPVDRPQEVDLDDAPYLVDRGLLDGAVGRDGRAVDPAVDATEMAGGLVRHSLHLLRVGDVGWRYQSPAPKRLDLGCRLPQRLFVPGDEYEGCAMSRQLMRGLPANPGRRSRNDDDLFGKGSGHSVLFASGACARRDTGAIARDVLGRISSSASGAPPGSQSACQKRQPRVRRVATQLKATTGLPWRAADGRHPCPRIVSPLWRNTIEKCSIARVARPSIRRGSSGACQTISTETE